MREYSDEDVARLFCVSAEKSKKYRMDKLKAMAKDDYSEWLIEFKKFAESETGEIILQSSHAREQCFKHGWHARDKDFKKILHLYIDLLHQIDLAKNPQE